MTSGKLTIYDRLENYALNGKTSSNLSLYLGQEKKLRQDGFTVTRINLTSSRHGQHSCKIDWSEAEVGTLAYEYLVEATRATSRNLSGKDEPLKPPYYY